MKKNFTNTTLIVALLLTASCSQNNHQSIVKACMAEGESQVDCTCFADVAEENLSPKAMTALGALARSEEEAASEILEIMSVDDALAFALMTGKAASDCKISGFGPL